MKVATWMDGDDPTYVAGYILLLATQMAKSGYTRSYTGTITAVVGYREQSLLFIMGGID